MNISRKWSAAAAGVLALALVGGGAVSANAAEGDIKNPQSNGSKGAFYVWDGTSYEVAEDPARIFDRAEELIITASATDALAEIMPADYVDGQNWTQTFKFVTKAGTEMGGTNTWLAYETTFAAGPNGGVLTDNFTLEGRSLANGAGIEKVFADGGEWIAGLAFTDFNGVAVRGLVYRTIDVEPGTGKFTVRPIEFEGAPEIEDVVEADLTGGLENTGLVTEVVDSKVLAIDAGVANANQTLNYGTFPAGLSGQVILDENGVGTIDAASVPVNVATKLYLAQNDNTVVAWDIFTLTQTVSTNDTTALTVDVTTSNRFELVAPAATSVDLGDVKRNQTSTPVSLGQFSVIDDRDELRGWNLNVSASAFIGPSAATIANTALGYSAVAAGGVQNGVTLGAAKAAGEGTFGVLAEGAENSSTTEDGAHFNADLTFKAPVDAVKGAYNSTLTLDLVSK